MSDTGGLLPDHCWNFYLDGYMYGFVEGVQVGREQVYAEIGADAARAVHNAAASIRESPANPYALRGTDEQLREHAAACRIRSIERFRADHARRLLAHQDAGR